MQLWTYNLVATVGHYKDKNWVEKKQYQTCWKVFIKEWNDWVYTSIKMDCLPVWPNRSWRFSVYPIEERKPKVTQTTLSDDIENDQPF